MRVDNHAAYFGVERYGWPDIAARPDNHAAYFGVERYGWPDSEARANDRAAYYGVEMNGDPKDPAGRRRYTKIDRHGHVDAATRSGTRLADRRGAGKTTVPSLARSPTCDERKSSRRNEIQESVQRGPATSKQSLTKKSYALFFGSGRQSRILTSGK